MIAEEVDKVFPLLVSRDENGNPYTVHYEALPILLLNEIKKQQETITRLQSLEPIVAYLQQEIIFLRKQMSNGQLNI